MRLVASIAPWLPWLRGILPYSVLLGGKAAELYYFSILEEPAPPLLSGQTLFGVEKGGNPFRAVHEHLLHQGFHRRSQASSGSRSPALGYYREDLGLLEFRCPENPHRKYPPSSGLAAVPDPHVQLLLEDPHSVELKYLGQRYSVRIPQTGRFILVNGLRVRPRPRATAEENFTAAQSLVLILYLLVLHPELEEEALNDLIEVKPPSLLRQFQENLKETGPGTTVWEGAQRSYCDLFPEVKAVQLTSWYWKFLPKVSKVIKERREGIPQ
jgi:hypothetical protein